MSLGFKKPFLVFLVPMVISTLNRAILRFMYGKKGEMSKLIAAVLLFFRRTKYMYVCMKQPNFWNKFEL